ncbi:MAG: N-acetyl-gamma-glutamyl-phosphate reductase [Niastella sp.]|uniref:N-acetyl-gamma-glutamyl-phosphate reductase n=1 Tax=Niastella sp. TaxID=1869183 RepID=UPI00389A5059
MSKKIKVGVIGGAGYTGGELLRLLINHPHVEIAFINSKSNAGNPISQVHADLIGETDLQFSDDLSPLQDGSVEVIFLCVGHGDARKFLTEYKVNDKIRIIDLSQDFRLAPQSAIGNRQFVYGLPELNKDQIKGAQNIANPGCFATGIQLGLLPLAKAGLLKSVYTTGITGSTGAGQGLSATSHFSWRANNIQAYKTLTHQHLKEITQSIQQLQPSFAPVTAEGSSEALSFIPWRGDFTRGIFVSSLVDCDWKLEQLIELYCDFYKGQPFTVLSKSEVFLKQVVNTNKCVIQLEKVGSKLVVHSAIDNLTKGASGQAVQNMNLIFGLDETAGLKLKANYF